MFWILSAALVAVVALAILAPTWRGRVAGIGNEPAAAYDLRVYRDQLREVERDLERGVIAPEDAARLKTEIGRKVLEADRRLAQPGPVARNGGAIWPVLALAVLLAGALGLYLRHGVPGAPDLPMAERLAAAERAYASRPSQAEAEAALPAAAAPATPPDEDYAALVQQLREAIERNPGDIQGLTLLATNEMRLGNIAAALAAQARLVELRGDEASGEEVMRLAALMIEAAGGIVTPEAEAQLFRALRQDPRQPQARYLLGMLQLQNGRPDRAFPLWRQLLEESPPDAPWVAPIRASISELAWLAGHPDYVPPAPPATDMAHPDMPGLDQPGPDAAQIEAAGDLPPEERRQMVENMVAGLEARLASQGGTPEEWARLISSLVVIGNDSHARDIWTEAQTRFAASPEALATVRAAAEEAGLIP